MSHKVIIVGGKRKNCEVIKIGIFSHIRNISHFANLNDLSILFYPPIIMILWLMKAFLRDWEWAALKKILNVCTYLSASPLHASYKRKLGLILFHFLLEICFTERIEMEVHCQWQLSQRELRPWRKDDGQCIDCRFSVVISIGLITSGHLESACIYQYNVMVSFVTRYTNSYIEKVRDVHLNPIFIFVN